MELKLSKPICFFDLETTGIDITKDRIVEISILKVYPNGNKESKTWLVNPTIPIPAMASALHGITDEKVANEPTFKELAKQIHNMIKDSDLAGYNSDRFDIPLLAEEMLRAGVDFDLGNRVTVDVQTIFHKMEQRTLSAAYKFYCGKDLLEAHTAAADTNATYEILKAQFLQRIGQNTLSIYIIHSIALYHFIPRLSLDYYFHKSLNPTEAIIGAILFVIGITTASYYYHKIYKYAKEKYFIKDK